MNSNFHHHELNTVVTLAQQDQSRVMRGSDDTSVRFCVRPVLSRVLGTLCTCIPLQHLLRGGLLLVFSSHDILNTRDDALSAPPSGRIVLWLPVAWNGLRPLRQRLEYGAVRLPERAALRQP